MSERRARVNMRCWYVWSKENVMSAGEDGLAGRRKEKALLVSGLQEEEGAGNGEGDERRGEEDWGISTMEELGAEVGWSGKNGWQEQAGEKKKGK